MKRGESMRSRGYTLIEIAGVMAVLGILLGASLLPLNRQLRESEYRQERANMERLRDAVLGYALRHRTPGVEIIMVNDDGIPVQPVFYAPGRPYLPCPDHNDDGIADRSDLIKSVTQTLSRSIFPPHAHTRVNTPILYNGACHVSKGQLPWRTLGSIPADYWGNRYTYFADTAFAQEATGFDENTVADSGERRLPRVRTPLGAYIPQKRTLLNIIEGPLVDGRPSVICPATPVAAADTTENNLICGRGGTPDAPANIVAGEPAPVTVDIDGQFLGPRDIADGLPFVIVSHGHNGRGAINHLLLRRGILVCRSFDGISVGEAVNVYRVSTRATAQQIVDGVFDNPCSPGTAPDSPPHISALFPLQGREEGYFFAHRSDVSAARAASSLSDQTGLDDLLVWMTRGDLARQMREARVFPLDSAPVFFEPGSR